MDRISPRSHISDKRLPIVTLTLLASKVALAESMAQRHGHNVGVVLCPVRYVGKSTLPVGRFEVNIVEPGIPVRVRTAGLRLSHVRVRVDEDALPGCQSRNVVPDLKTGGVSRPDRISCHDIVRNPRAISVAQGTDQGELEWNIGAASVVDLVDHLDRIRPKHVRHAGNGTGGRSHSNKVEAYTRRPRENIVGRCEFQTLRDHCLATEGPIDASPGNLLASGVDNVSPTRVKWSIWPDCRVLLLPLSKDSSSDRARDVGHNIINRKRECLAHDMCGQCCHRSGD